MGALTNPGTNCTELSGTTKLVSIYNLTTTTATDTIQLSSASNGITAIQNVIAGPAFGLNSGFTQAGVTYSNLIVTFDNVEQGGTAATVFGGVNLLVIGTG